MARATTLSLKEWEAIDAVLLDMDGTLLDLSFDNYFWQQAVPEFYAAEKGIDLEQSHRYLSQFFQDYSGTLNWYCTDFWSEKLGLDIIRFKTELSDKIALRPGTERFLKKIRASNKKVILVTNAHPETLRIKLDKTEIAQYFDALYSSHQFNQPKESPLFWTQLEQDLQISLEKCVFIDDTESILLRAKQSGVKHVVMVEQPDMSKPARDNLSLPSVNDLTHLFD